MHVKIWFNDKPLFLADTIADEVATYARHDDAVLIDEFSSPGIKSMIHEMRQEKVHAGIYYHKDLPELQKAFFKKFVRVQAAGGLVLNSEGEILMIFRRGKWDLPKGKLDKGETLEACAVREVQEETGLHEVALKKPLVVTYHTYDESGKHILKESHWYLLEAAGKQELKPQTAEQITQAEWVNPALIKRYISNTFPSVIDVLKAGGFL